MTLRALASTILRALGLAFALAGFAVAALFPTLAAGTSTPPAHELFQLGFASNTVIVEGLTLGGKVVWFGAAQSLAEDDVVEIHYYARIGQDSDFDAREQLALPEGVPTHGAFVAIDLTTGMTAAAASPGYVLRQVPWQGAGVIDSGQGEDAIEDARPLANVLVARPGIGAWAARVRDGGAEDDDGEIDGQWRLLLSSLHPLGDTVSPVPARILPVDVVTVIDPRRLELTLVTPQPSPTPTPTPAPSPTPNPTPTDEEPTP